MQRCSQMAKGVYEVHSASNWNKTYIVTAFDGKPPTCTCPAYAIGRNRSVSVKPGAKPGQAWCKHIEYIYDTVCQWESGSDTLQKEPGICPLCGKQTVFDDDDEITETATESAALASLREMIAEIENK